MIFTDSVTFDLCRDYLMKGALAEVVDFKVGGRNINEARFADDKAILAKMREELKDILNQLVNTGRKYDMVNSIHKSQEK